MKLLHLDSAITGENSVSARLSQDIVTKLTSADPSIEVTHRDLAADPLNHLTLADVPAPGTSTPVLDQFLESDIIVIGAPMYNFTVPSQLKAWIDRITIAGKTFRYTEAGPEGLAGGRRVIVALSRGGMYGPDTPNAAAEHVRTYLTALFGWLGITPEFVLAEGIAYGPDQRAAAIKQAEEQIAALAA